MLVSVLILANIDPQDFSPKDQTKNCYFSKLQRTCLWRVNYLITAVVLVCALEYKEILVLIVKRHSTNNNFQSTCACACALHTVNSRPI